VTVGSRALVAAASATLLLGLSSPALADHGKPQAPTTTSTRSVGTTISVQGVVQALSGSVVVVRQLDGSAVSIAIDRKTKVTIDGRPDKISDVKPGFVLLTTVKTGQPAASLRFLRPS
jgi:hypothetical protein